jgi:pyrimidine operon attenuation protein/uracil phosphoribosyltransferase
MPDAPARGAGEPSPVVPTAPPADEATAPAASQASSPDSAPDPSRPPSPAPETLLAFDFGTRRIGVALGNTLTGSARSLAIVDSVPSGRRFERIDALIREWRPDRLVVGRPLDEAGAATPTTRLADRFANQLRGRFGLPVEPVDERYSSREAQAIIASGEGRRGRGHASDDAVAAAVLLAQYLEARGGPLAQPPPTDAPHRRPRPMTAPAEPAAPSAPGLDAEAIYADLRAAVAARLAGPPARRPAVVGIHSGGAWVARRLHADLCPEAPLGFLSSAFHRDDYAQRGLRATGGGTTRIDFEVDGADILLVDDILFTGRTIRAALNEIFDYGRPRRVELAVLLDRGGRELPVQADHVGAVLPLQHDQGFVLGQDDQGRFTLAVEPA